MKSRIAEKRDGQTLVLVAILLTVLLAFLALAIDVGYMYAGRRQMQNAADAGALAGAYELCFGDPEKWQTTALDYAINRNGAQEATAEKIPNDWTVNVVARQTVDLLVADVIGLGTVDVGAEAEAACGAAESASGLWPIAFDVVRWGELYAAGCGTRFYVWAGQNENQNPDCDIYECDVPDPEYPYEQDGIEDIVDMQGRAWLDFTDNLLGRYDQPDVCVKDPEKPGPGCGANELRCWILNDTRARIKVGDCIDGTSGVIAGVKDQIDERYDEDILIPLFDYMGCDSPAHSCPGGDTYNVVAFGCIKVVGWIHELVLPRKDGGNPPWKDKAIAVTISCDACVTASGGTTGRPPEPWEVRAVSLIK